MTDVTKGIVGARVGVVRHVRLGVVVLLGAVALGGVVARFAVSSPLWLDEALSVAIADLGPDGLVGALRRDGHPPLYYLLLSGWMGMFGDGDLAVRAMSGVFSVGAFPVVYAVARRRVGSRAGWFTVVLVATSPWAVRYGGEARMYSLVFLLVAIGWWAADDVWRGTVTGRNRTVRLAVVAGATGATLWTHYWALWLGAGAVVVLAVRSGRAGPQERRALRDLAAALVVGLLTFVPWAPVLAHQAANTGTPWASATRPTRAVVEVFGGLGGGEGFAEGLLAGIAVVAVVLLGVVLHRVDGPVLTLDLRTTPAVRPEVALVAATVVVGLVAGAVTDSVFVARYAAVFLPFVFVAAGVTLARLPPGLGLSAAAVVVVLSVPGIVFAAVDDRTQGGEIGGVVAAEAGGDDLVVFCPDQLGPSAIRVLDARGADVRAVGLPTLDRPTRVDWTDYEARNRSADPVALTLGLSSTTVGRVFLVTRPGYRTYEGFCEQVAATLTAERGPGRVLVADRSPDVFEPASLVLFERVPD